MIARHQPPAVGHVIVGGGLAGGLVALALANLRRGNDVVLIERDVRLGGNHTWSFHDTDLDDARARPDPAAGDQPLVVAGGEVPRAPADAARRVRQRHG